MNQSSFILERSTDKQVPCLKLTLKTGVSLAFLYSHIYEAVYISTSEIEIYLPHKHIKIFGNSLELLFTGLCQQRVKEIIESSNSFASKRNMEAQIFRIEIEKKY